MFYLSPQPRCIVHSVHIQSFTLRCPSIGNIYQTVSSLSFLSSTEALGSPRKRTKKDKSDAGTGSRGACLDLTPCPVSVSCHLAISPLVPLYKTPFHFAQGFCLSVQDHEMMGASPFIHPQLAQYMNDRIYEADADRISSGRIGLLHLPLHYEPIARTLKGNSHPRQCYCVPPFFFLSVSPIIFLLPMLPLLLCGLD